MSLVAPIYTRRSLQYQSKVVWYSTRSKTSKTIIIHGAMDQQILSGFRIGVLSPNSLYEVALATSVGASAVKIYEEAIQCNSQAEFETYLNLEMRRAKDEGETLVVLRRPLRTRWCGFLDHIEEKEFYGAEKEHGSRVLFVTTKCLN